MTLARQIKVVSFDLDGTLVEDAFDDAIWFEEIPQRYAAKHALPLPQATERVLAEYRALRGHPRWTDMAFWFDRFALGDWRDAVAARQHLIRLYPETAEVLQALAPRYRLVIITQAERKFREIKLRTLRLGERALGAAFEAVFATPDHFGRLAKDEEVYREVLRRLGVAPHEMLHIGDHSEYDVAVPRALGIHALHLDRRGTRRGPDVIHDLRALLPLLLP